MRAYLMYVAVALAVVAAIAFVAAAGGWATRPGSGWVEGVILPTGAVIHYPTENGVRFSVPAGGAVLVGGAYVDHQASFGAYPINASFACGSESPNATYYGSAWSYSVNQSLAPGEYWWGAPCGAFANVTVTQSFVLLSP